jgi:uncharacterized protein YkwD
MKISFVLLLLLLAYLCVGVFANESEVADDGEDGDDELPRLGVPFTSSSNGAAAGHSLLSTASSSRSLALLTSTLAAAKCSHADQVPGESAISVSQYKAAIYCLHNEIRRKYHKSTFKAHPALEKSAKGHSSDMVRRKYFDHNSKAGRSPTDRIKAAGYLKGARSWSTGENIAWGGGKFASARAIMSAWMHSAGHRANIMGAYKHLGIGVVFGAPSGSSSNAVTVTANFGRK